MNSVLRIPLHPTPEQAQRLVELQHAFAQVCNALAPTVRERRCWNRVTLHHLTYHAIRESHPHVGSQMVCNAIYAVCRAARAVYQHPDSPFHLSRIKGDRIPLLQFESSCPVYFDRHTLSLRGSQLSMYTLDGRMHFKLALTPTQEAGFREQRLREILLRQAADGAFELVFTFAQEGDGGVIDATPHAMTLPAAPLAGAIPDYLKIEERPEARNS